MATSRLTMFSTSSLPLSDLERGKWWYEGPRQMYSSVVQCVFRRAALCYSLLFLFIAGPATHWTAVSAPCQPHHNALLMKGMATGQTHQQLLAHKVLQTHHTLWALQHVTGPNRPVAVLMVRDTIGCQTAVLLFRFRWWWVSVPVMAAEGRRSGSRVHVVVRRELCVAVLVAQWSLGPFVAVWRSAGIRSRGICLLAALGVWMWTICLFVQLSVRILSPVSTISSEPPGWQGFNVIHVY